MSDIQTAKAKITFYCNCPVCDSEITYILDNDKTVECFSCLQEINVDWEEVYKQLNNI